LREDLSTALPDSKEGFHRQSFSADNRQSVFAGAISGDVVERRIKEDERGLRSQANGEHVVPFRRLFLGRAQSPEHTALSAWVRSRLRCRGRQLPGQVFILHASMSH
jgi:hypothetical protein